MSDTPPRCGTCRWHGMTRTGLGHRCSLRKRSVRTDAGTNCTLWDPIVGERYPARPQAWATCSSISWCEEHMDTTDVPRLCERIRRRMIELGIPTGLMPGEHDDEEEAE